MDLTVLGLSCILGFEFDLKYPIWMLLFAEGRAALAATVCRGNGAAAAAVKASSAGANSGYSRWFPAAAFLPAAGTCLCCVKLISIGSSLGLHVIHAGGKGILRCWNLLLGYFGLQCTWPRTQHSKLLR